MIRLLLLAASLAVALPVAGCGQKGPLYLPGNPSAVQVSPEQSRDEAPVDDDEEDDAEERDDEDESSVDER